MTVLIKNSGDEMSYRVYVDDILDADITDAVFAQYVPSTSPATPADLTFGSAVPDNLTDPKSVVVEISGGEHGRTYQCTGTFTLDSGGELVRNITVRVFDS